MERISWGKSRKGVLSPGELVSLASLPDLKGVHASDDGLGIGAMTTLADILNCSYATKTFPALAQAIASVATPQIRNVGTLGGNLCQRPRCWYYRSPLFDCRKKGGAICYAINGSNKYHAILGGRDCFIVHPSDLAVALISYRAKVNLTGAEGTRSIPIEDFFVGPEQDMMAETVLRPGEILTSVALPAPPAGTRSVYLKSRERGAQDFALVSVALVVQIADGLVQDARLTLGGVAPVPHRAAEVENLLRLTPVDDIDPAAAGEMAVRGARPLRDNHYKVRLASSLVSRAVRCLLTDESGGDG